MNAHPQNLKECIAWAREKVADLALPNPEPSAEIREMAERSAVRNPVAFISATLKQLFPTFNIMIARAMLPALGEVEQRLEALESREYQGVFDPLKAYSKGAFVTSKGSMFVATVDTTGVVPGDGNVWKLAVKRGRDAKSSSREQQP